MSGVRLRDEREARAPADPEVPGWELDWTSPREVSAVQVRRGARVVAGQIVRDPRACCRHYCCRPAGYS